jgi:hypothetical protein
VNRPEVDIVDALEEFIRDRDHVSMIEIGEFLRSHGVEVEGERSLEIDRNIVLWAGMSDPFIDIMDQLQGRGSVIPTWAGYSTYSMDGRILPLPLANQPPTAGYKKPHWLPVCFRPAEKVTGDRCPPR